MAYWHTIPGTGAQEKALTKLEYATRITFAWESALDQLQEHPDCPRNIAADIRTMMRWLDRPDDVRPSDPRTQALTDNVLAIMSAAPLMGLIGRTALTPTEAATERARILDPVGPEPVSTPPVVVIG